MPTTKHPRHSVSVRKRPTSTKAANSLPPELHEPIKVFRPTIAHGPDAGPNTPDELALAAFLQAVRKLELLFRVHGVPRTGNDAVDYLGLSLALARQLYRGFHLEPMAKGQYEHNRSNAVSLTMLLADVERVKQEKGIRSDRAAIGDTRLQRP
jgi:hypothetical protein